MCTDDQATPERTVPTPGVQTFRWRGGSPGAHLPPGLPAGRGPGSENLVSRFRGRCGVGHAGINGDRVFVPPSADGATPLADLGKGEHSKTRLGMPPGKV